MKKLDISRVSKLPSPTVPFFLLIFIAISNLSDGQVLTDYPCYSISENNAAPNVLFEYDPATALWYRVGETGGSFIEALATDPLTNTIYAVDGDMFGIVDVETAEFSPIGKPGVANGDLGSKILDDVDGLTYDVNNQIMYASHRIQSLDPETNDLLFQIDVATGKVVPGAMLDTNGNAADYAVVEGVIEQELGQFVYDVDDIAINPYTGKLYAIQNQDGPSTITQIDPLTGKVIAVVFDIEADDVEGLGFTYLGELYATTGSRGVCGDGIGGDCYNTFIYIDLINLKEEVLNFIDPTRAEVDFESFDCFTSFNDLALVYKLDENTPQQINPGDQVTFNVKVINQGGFDNSEITIINYIPTGLILTDTDWVGLNSAKASYTIRDNLQIGTSVTVPVTFKIDENFEGKALKSIAEISSSFSPGLTNNRLKPDDNNMMQLPDVDSTPDDINNEINVVDDEINGKGLNSNFDEDEDDHDIAFLSISSGSDCISSLNLNNEFLNAGIYKAGENITCQSQIIGPNIEFIAGKSVTLNGGFNVAKITTLSALIAECE